jgi:hypothetical protein
MPKAIIWLLVGLGFFFLLIGFIFSKFLLVIGLFIIAVGLLLGLGPDGILRNDQVLDSWATLIENAQSKSAEIFQKTQSFIRESKAPAIRIELKNISPGIVRGLMGTTREFLTITDQENGRLEPYQIYINARDYGNNLDVSWYLTYKPTLLQSIAALLPYVNVIPSVLSDLDLFDQQDLRAYTTNAHHCLLKAVDQVMISLNQDPSKIDRKSKGFLGIS